MDIKIEVRYDRNFVEKYNTLYVPTNRLICTLSKSLLNKQEYTLN